MGSASKKKTAVRQLDDLFLQIFEAMTAEVTKVSAAAAEQVLQLSGSFLSERAQKAVSQFHNLYFGSAAIEQSKIDVNADVDRLFDDIQGAVAKGQSDAAIHEEVKENADLKASRLRLSGVQKELETLIRLDQGIRDRLVPVLTSMQFEDMVKHRLQNILSAWQSVVTGFDRDGILDVEMLCVEIEANLSSNQERELFYRLVLKKEPPAANLDADSVWTDLK